MVRCDSTAARSPRMVPHMVPRRAPLSQRARATSVCHATSVGALRRDRGAVRCMTEPHRHTVPAWHACASPGACRYRCLVVNADDDIVCHPRNVRTDLILGHPGALLLQTRHGSHVAFCEGAFGQARAPPPPSAPLPAPPPPGVRRSSTSRSRLGAPPRTEALARACAAGLLPRPRHARLFRSRRRGENRASHPGGAQRSPHSRPRSRSSLARSMTSRTNIPS
jgi:hypothetical protein